MKFYRYENPGNYYYGHYGKSYCEHVLEPCLRELADLVVSLPDVPDRIFVVHQSGAMWSTVSGWTMPATSREARIYYDYQAKRVGDVISAHLTNDTPHWADDNPVQPWQWQRADASPDDVNAPDDATWTDIEGARTFWYVMKGEDLGKFLRAYVSYEKDGATHQVQTEAAGPVEEEEADVVFELLGEQVSLEIVIYDQLLDLSLITYAKEPFELAARSAWQSVVSGEPVIRSDFDVYLGDDRVAYVKEPCVPADMEAIVFLSLYPVDVHDLPDHRRQHGFDNLDFDLRENGAIIDGKCTAVRSLPEYDIARISTGQYVRVVRGYNHLWEGEFPADRAGYDRRIDEIIEQAGEPALRSTFDVYLNEGRLIYVKDPCVPADTEATFFLALYPVDVNDLPDRSRPHGFDNLDFDFHLFGRVFDGRCAATVALPEYAIATIGTGQYVPVEGGFHHFWEGEFSWQDGE